MYMCVCRPIEIEFASSVHLQVQEEEPELIETHLNFLAKCTPLSLSLYKYIWCIIALVLQLALLYRRNGDARKTEQWTAALSHPFQQLRLWTLEPCICDASRHIVIICAKQWCGWLFAARAEADDVRWARRQCDCSHGIRL